MQRRENETITQFAMRQVRNEIIEECVKTIQMYDPAAGFIVDRLRAMKDEW